MNEWVKDKGVILCGGGLDESPLLPAADVLAVQKEATEVLHTDDRRSGRVRSLLENWVGIQFASHDNESYYSSLATE